MASYTINKIVLPNGDDVSLRDTSKLPKKTYEWNKAISFGGSGFLKIGSFPMYDTNVTIDIDATTSKTYHGTVVIATQNVSTSSMGSAHKIQVYGDPTGVIASSLRIVWTSGSRNYNIYFVPQPWSKNFIHISALGNYMDGVTDICISQTGTVPTTTSGLEPENILSGMTVDEIKAGTSTTNHLISPANLKMAIQTLGYVHDSIQVNLNDITWSRSGGGLYYSSTITIPDSPVVLLYHATLSGFANLRATDIITPACRRTAGWSGFVLYANTNEFLTNAWVTVSVSGLPYQVS